MGDDMVADEIPADLDGGRLRFEGERSVAAPVVAVLTRFALRRPWHLLQTYVSYRWLMRRIRRAKPEGLIASAFLIEGPTTCYSLSMWASERAIPWFGTHVDGHTQVARGIFGRLRYANGRPELWSTKWRLVSVSGNLNWDGVWVDTAGTLREAEG
jgi:hypothetical protein